MAGLLDTYQVDPLAQGLLGLSGALLTPRSQGGGIGAGFGAFNQGMLQAQQMQRQAQQDAMRQQLLQAQIGRYESSAEQEKAEAEARRTAAQRSAELEQGQRSVLGRIAARSQPGFRDASIAMTGAAPAGYQPPGAGPTLTQQDVAEWVAYGGKPETLEAIVKSKDWGRAEVSGTVKTTDAQGRPVERMRDRFGGFIGDALPQAYERKTVDLGGQVVERDPYTGQQVGALSKSMTPEGRDASARGWAGQRLSQERFNFDRAQAAQGGPDGGFQYMQTPTGIVAVPKKPSADGTIQARPVLDAMGAPVGGTGQTTAQQRVTDAKDAIDVIKQAEDLIDKATNSFFGAGLDMAGRAVGFAPGSAQAAAQLQALEGILVSKMPKMSGPQSDKDVQLYRQMAGKIGDPTIPSATKKAALQTIKEIQSRYAGVPFEPVAPASPAPRTGNPMSGALPGGGVDLQEMARRELARRKQGGASGSF